MTARQAEKSGCPPTSKQKPWHGDYFAADSSNIVDLLRTAPSQLSFERRVKNIGLSAKLETKILQRHRKEKNQNPKTVEFLSAIEEKELATEVLLGRHNFTCCVFENSKFRQAAITIIQNIYLFRQRRIFFGASGASSEEQRQEALLLFSQSPDNASIPLAKTFQHLILARVWDRIINQASDSFLESPAFLELHAIVEKLNTLRNIYMLLCINLVHKLTRQVSSIYRQSITDQDAHQIGAFGIARAAYRYHPSAGQRFSTYAARWIHKEIQRQALEGRLIRISSHMVETLSRTAREGDSRQHEAAYNQISKATAQLSLSQKNDTSATASSTVGNPQAWVENRDYFTKLLQAIDTLSEKSRDIILRRYGLGPYSGHEQSVIEISKIYGVTRGSIYQLEQTALKKLRQCLPSFYVS